MFTEASRTFQDIYGQNLRKASTSLHQLSSLFLSVKPWSFAYLVYSDFKLENGCTASRIFSVLPQLLSITTQALSDAGYKVFHHVHRCPSIGSIHPIHLLLEVQGRRGANRCQGAPDQRPGRGHERLSNVLARNLSKSGMGVRRPTTPSLLITASKKLFDPDRKNNWDWLHSGGSCYEHEVK